MYEFEEAADSIVRSRTMVPQGVADAQRIGGRNPVLIRAAVAASPFASLATSTVINEFCEAGIGHYLVPLGFYDLPQLRQPRVLLDITPADFVHVPENSQDIFLEMLEEWNMSIQGIADVVRSDLGGWIGGTTMHLTQPSRKLRVLWPILCKPWKKLDRDVADQAVWMAPVRDVADNVVRLFGSPDGHDDNE